MKIIGPYSSYICYTGSNKNANIKQYNSVKNNKSTNLKVLEGLQGNMDMKDKNNKQLLDSFKDSINMQMSPVNFLVNIIADFLQTDMSYEQFLDQYCRNSKQALEEFNNLPQENINDSKRIFARELFFADSLKNSILESPDRNAFEEKLYKLLNDYCK